MRSSTRTVLGWLILIAALAVWWHIGAFLANLVGDCTDPVHLRYPEDCDWLPFYSRALLLGLLFAPAAMLFGVLVKWLHSMAVEIGSALPGRLPRLVWDPTKDQGQPLDDMDATVRGSRERVFD